MKHPVSILQIVKSKTRLKAQRLAWKRVLELGAKYEKASNGSKVFLNLLLESVRLAESIDKRHESQFPIEHSKDRRK